VHRCQQVCGPAKEYWRKKNQNISVWVSRMVLAQDAEAGSKAKPKTCCPGGLLLVVVSHRFAVPVLVLWMG